MKGFAGLVAIAFVLAGWTSAPWAVFIRPVAAAEIDVAAEAIAVAEAPAIDGKVDVLRLLLR